LIRHALPSYHEIGAALSTTLPKLWSIFIAAATDLLVGDVDCVLDALDECNEQEQGNDESASIKKEIDLVIKHRVTELAQENRLPQKVRDHLERRLLEIEHRIYLWLRLL